MSRPTPGTALVAFVPVDLTLSDPGSPLPPTTPAGVIFDALARVQATRRAILHLMPSPEVGDYHGSA